MSGRYALLVIALALANCGQEEVDRVDTTLPGNDTAGAQASIRNEIAAAPPIDLDGVLTFADPAQCVPTPAFRRLLERMLVYDESADRYRVGGSVSLPGIGQALSPELAVTRIDEEDLQAVRYVSSLRMPGEARWHGLRVSRLVSTYVDVFESDDADLRAINFLESPEEVRRVLAARGFGAPLSPDYRELEDEVCGGAMQIVAIPGGSALQCSFGC